MKIATWNIERMAHSPAKIQFACEQVGADILILTESDDRICPGYEYAFHTPTPPDIEGSRFGTIRYAPTEHRVSVFTNYPCVRRHTTADEYTSLCVELETERGNLLVYGTIIGTHDVTTVFPQDLKRQLPDFERLTADGNRLCVCGDFNCFFTGRCWPSRAGRDALLQAFSQNRMKLLTREQPDCIDHIAISEQFLGSDAAHIEEWNLDKKLSDHKGIAIQFGKEG